MKHVFWMFSSTSVWSCIWYVDLKTSYFFKVLQPKLLGQGMSGLPTFYQEFPHLLPQNVSEFCLYTPRSHQIWRFSFFCLEFSDFTHVLEKSDPKIQSQTLRSKDIPWPSFPFPEAVALVASSTKWQEGIECCRESGLPAPQVMLVYNAHYSCSMLYPT